MISLREQAEVLGHRTRELLNLQSTARDRDLSGDKPTSVLLAHYTSLEALISMIQGPNGGLRLSDSSTMNDPDEGRTSSDGKEFFGMLKEEFGETSWPWRRYSAAHICCFVGVSRGAIRESHERLIDPGNDLLFWRLYGNECRGVSITIAAHESKRLVSSSLVQKVIYADDPPSKVSLAELMALLRDLNEFREEARDADVWSEVCSKVLPLCDRMFGQRFLHKHSHYEMEREYRAVEFLTMNEDEAAENLSFF